MSRAPLASLLFCVGLTAACEPVPARLQHLVEPWQVATADCAGACVVGEVLVGAAAVEAGGDLDLRPVDAASVPLAPIEEHGEVMAIDIREREYARAGGHWEHGSVRGTLTIDRVALELALQADPNDRGRARGGVWRPLTRGAIDIDGERLCVAPGSVALIASDRVCDYWGGITRSPRLHANLKIVAVGERCEEPAEGRVFVRYQGPRYECPDDSPSSWEDAYCPKG